MFAPVTSNKAFASYEGRALSVLPVTSEGEGRGVMKSDANPMPRILLLCGNRSRTPAAAPLSLTPLG
jgi:hypothetical protein